MRLLNCLNRCRRFLGFDSPKRRPEMLRSRPTLEALEDRLVLSTATQSTTVLTINASPGFPGHGRSILMEVDPIDHTKIDVIDSGTVLGKFTISSINKVNVNVAGFDAIKADDTNGFPFAPGTTITLAGGGLNNSLVLQGSQVFNDQELFDAGTSTQNGLLSMGGSTFRFTGAISKVTDDVTNTDEFFVQTTAPLVSLAGPNGVTETLTGLAGPGGGGNTLTFRGQRLVDLQERGDNATTTLNATQTALGLKGFIVEQFGKNDTLNINAAPTFAADPSGELLVTNPGQQDQVNLRANTCPVNIFGLLTTTVVLGSNDTDFSKSVTSGINGFVGVHNVGVLNIEDAGNVTTQEHVTVTESTVSGTGLFGTSGSLQYSSLIPGDLVPSIFTGQLANTYTVTTSSPVASFNNQGLAILISDASTTAGLSVLVKLDANSDLGLSVISKDPAASSVFISAPVGTFYTPFIMPKPTGFEQATPPSATHSSGIFYEGFDTAGHS